MTSLTLTSLCIIAILFHAPDAIIIAHHDVRAIEVYDELYDAIAEAL